MKRVSLVALATLALLSAAACQDAVTSPQLGAELRNSSNPPPPPVAETATGSFTPTDVFSIQQSCFFNVPVKFFYNPKENNGWVHFENSSTNGVTASSNGMVTYKKGDFSGKGTLQILVPGCGLIVIDLSSVDGSQSFFCQGDQNCFHLHFNVAKEYPCGNTGCPFIVGTAFIEGGPDLPSED